MTDRLWRHQAKLNRRAESDPLSALETSVSRAIEYRVNPYTDALAGTAEPAWHGFCFRSADYAAAFRELNATLAWTPGRFARTSAAAHRSNMLQLIILIAVAAALALWAFLTRRP
jgi:hypothetical protein